MQKNIIMKPKIRILYDRKKQATKITPALIQIEIYYKGKKKYISTGIKVKPGEWDDGNKQIKGTNNDFNDNHHITNLCRKIEDFIIDCERRGDEFSFTTLGLLITGNIHSAASFQTYCLELLSRKKIAKTTSKKLMSFINHIERFGKLKTFADLTPANIKQFDKYLSDAGLSKPSVYGRHKNLKNFINEAIGDGYLKQSPYIGLKFDKGKSKDPTFLLESEIDLVRKYLPQNDKLIKVKDLFLFQCFTGLSYSDLAVFSKNDITQLDDKKIIRSNRNKTDQSFISLLLPEAEEILVKYEYKLPIISNAKYNDYLKLLGCGANISKKLTTHTARHTYATYLLNKGISISSVSKAMGHSSTRMTEHYAKLLGKTVISEMSAVFLEPQQKKETI